MFLLLWGTFILCVREKGKIREQLSLEVEVEGLTLHKGVLQFIALANMQ